MPQPLFRRPLLEFNCCHKTRRQPARYVMGHVESELVPAAGSAPSLLLGLPRHTVTEGRSIAMGRLDNKVAVITGAASGIGRAAAIRFAAEGAAVVVADLNIDGGEATVRECREHAGRAVFQKTDVSAEADIKSMIARAVAEFGRLDITFNNAGFVGALGPLEDISAENWDRTHAVLLRGVFLGIKYSIPEMRKAGGLNHLDCIHCGDARRLRTHRLQRCQSGRD